MLERYKKQHDGILALALLLESSAASKQKKIVEVGIKENPAFMNEVLSYIISWEDVTTLEGPPLGELLYVAKPNIIAIALFGSPKELVDKFLVACKEKMGQIKDAIEYPKSSTEPAMVSTARMELIKNYRSLVATKKIPQPKKNPADIKKKLGLA